MTETRVRYSISPVVAARRGSNMLVLEVGRGCLNFRQADDERDRSRFPNTERNQSTG
jgi:hypothetical protein